MKQDEQLDLAKLMMRLIDTKKEYQVKYVYYVIALNVSAIGYSIYRTIDHTFNLMLIPWGSSLICWSISIYCGLGFLQKIIRGFDFDIRFLLNKKEGGTQDVTIENFQGEILDTLANYSRWQNRLFYLGIILFIVWHISELYIAS